MKKISVLFLAVLLAGCGKEKTIVPAAPDSGKTEGKPLPPTQEKPRWRDFPKRSPFEAIRWHEAVPEIRVQGVWYELLSLDGIASQEIVVFCQKTDMKTWQKRFDEDLVEILSRMGHDPGKNAMLKVRQLDSGREQVLKDVPWTEENRKAIWKARGQRQSRGGRSEEPSAVSRLTRRQAEEDLDRLASLLEDRYAYLQRKGVDHRAALANIRRRVSQSISTSAFAMELMKLLALFGDGHTRVADPDQFLPPGYAPFLVGDADGRLVAFKEDRSGFLDPERPYLRGLDGMPVEKWLQAAARIAPGGSPQLVRWQSIRNLRYMNYLRQELGLAAKTTLRVELESTPTRSRRTIEIELTKDKPLYGDWPRGTHRILPGNIGYLRIERMSDDPRFLRGLTEFMTAFRRTRGLIVDVRGNGGGSRAVLRELAPFFMKPADPARIVNVAAYRLGDKEKPDAAEGYLRDRSLHPVTSHVWSASDRAILEAFEHRFKPEWMPPHGEFSPWHYFLLHPPGNVCSSHGLGHEKAKTIIAA